MTTTLPVNPHCTTAYRERLELQMGVPFTDGNLVRALNNGVEVFPAMLAAIAAAQRTIDFETYVYWRGEIAVRVAGALAERARAGVRVRVLLDAVGALPMDPELVRAMEGAGAEVRWFRPVATWRIGRTDNRTHRKLLICDGQVGFTGGIGIAEEWEGDARDPSEWRDMHIRIDGPAVGGLRAAFVENWNESGKWSWDECLQRPEPHPGGVPVQIVRASATVEWTDIATLMHTLVRTAERELVLATAYFVPDEQMIRLLIDARERGVDVRLLLQGEHGDSPLSKLASLRRVETLLTAGLRVFRYNRTLLHTKCLTVDGVLSCIGSANCNHRSLSKDEECCAVILCPVLTGELNGHLAADLEHADEVDVEQMRRRGWWVRAQERIAESIVGQL
jgi:cardiolipin synthase